jgi:N-acyl-L-homoserine lactone synthetase
VVCVVTSANRERWRAELDSMFMDRKRVFIDRLKWDLKVEDGIYERDQYDTDRSVYLIFAEPATHAHICSMRLMPTTAPHLLKDVFPDLCDGEIPVGDDIWEVTRLCTSPSLKGDAARNARRHLSIAMVEFGLLYGLSRLTMITHMEYLSRLLAVGWECRPLGLPKKRGEQLFGAMEVNITPATLKAIRMQFGGNNRTPLLELEGLTAAA